MAQLARRQAQGGKKKWAGVSLALLGASLGRARKAVLQRRAGAAPPHAAAGAANPPGPSPAAQASAAAQAASGGNQAIREPFYQPALVAWKEFNSDNGMLMSAAVAFFVVLSIIPLLLVGVSVLGHVLGSSSTARDQVMDFFRQFMAGSKGRQAVEELVRGIIDARGLIGGVGLAGLLMTALGGFSTLETAINVIWDCKRRNFLMSKLWALGLFVVIGVLFALSFALTTMVSWASRLPLLGWVAQNFGAQATGLLAPALVSGAMFSLIYKWVPNCGVAWRPALISGALAGLLFELFKTGYALYSATQDNSAAYGAVGGVIALVMWIYYSSILLLLGSELCWVLSGRPGAERKSESIAVQRED